MGALIGGLASEEKVLRVFGRKRPRLERRDELGSIRARSGPAGPPLVRPRCECHDRHMCGKRLAAGVPSSCSRASSSTASSRRSERRRPRSTAARGRSSRRRRRSRTCRARSSRSTRRATRPSGTTAATAASGRSGSRGRSRRRSWPASRPRSRSGSRSTRARRAPNGYSIGALRPRLRPGVQPTRRRGPPPSRCSRRPSATRSARATRATRATTTSSITIGFVSSSVDLHLPPRRAGGPRRALQGRHARERRACRPPARRLVAALPQQAQRLREPALEPQADQRRQALPGEPLPDPTGAGRATSTRASCGR